MRNEKSKSKEILGGLLQHDREILLKLDDIIQKVDTIDRSNKKFLMTALQNDGNEEKRENENYRLKMGIISLLDEIENVLLSCRGNVEEDIQYGLDIIEKNILQITNGMQIEEIPAKAGDEFDPELHKCEFSEDEPQGVISEVIKKGYRDIKDDKVLRYALVAVK